MQSMCCCCFFFFFIRRGGGGGGGGREGGNFRDCTVRSNADWLATLIITLLARADHVWAKCSGQKT